MPKYRIETIENKIMQIETYDSINPVEHTWVETTDGTLINLNHAVRIEEIKSPLQIWEEN